MTMESIGTRLAHTQASGEKHVDWAIARNETRRIVPLGDDFRGAGQTVRAATASFAVDSAALTSGKRYKCRYIDAAASVAFIRTKLATAVTIDAAATDYPLVPNDEFYLYCPLDGTWDTVSFFCTNLTGYLNIIESGEKEEDRL